MRSLKSRWLAGVRASSTMSSASASVRLPFTVWETRPWCPVATIFYTQGSRSSSEPDPLRRRTVATPAGRSSESDGASWSIGDAVDAMVIGSPVARHRGGQQTSFFDFCEDVTNRSGPGLGPEVFDVHASRFRGACHHEYGCGDGAVV